MRKIFSKILAHLLLHRKKFSMAIVGTEKMDWAKRLAGLGKGNWSGIDAQKYIDNLRNEWER